MGAKAAVAKSSGFKRRYPRYALDVRLKARMLQNGAYENCWGRSTELGQDGIGATLTGELQAGEIITLEIPLPLSTQPLNIRAIVRFRNGLRYGLEFLAVTSGQRQIIERVCDFLANGQ
jgi:hypothetical protein